MTDLPSLALVIGTAVINAINPFTIGVFIMLLSIVLGSGFSRRRLMSVGGIYLLTTFFTYLLLGLFVNFIFNSLPIRTVGYITLVLAVLVIVAGIIEIKDYFWYGKGISLQVPSRYAVKIHKWAKRRADWKHAVTLALFVVLISLPYNGTPYLAVVAILHSLSLSTAFINYGLYSLVFVLPLGVLLAVIANGGKLSTVTKWKEESKGTMRLYTGLLFIALGWILLLVANGTVNFR